MAHEVEQEIDRAIVRMTARGWMQDDWADADGRVCLMGALRNAQWVPCMCTLEGCGSGAVVLPEEENYDTVSFLRDVLHQQYPGTHYYEVAEFNDNVITSEAEAISVLEKARARAAEKGI
jgi:hypothetical protein